VLLLLLRLLGMERVIERIVREVLVMRIRFVVVIMMANGNW
jgi:hypothetical protein